MLWLLLCDARRLLVGASAESGIERGSGTTSTTAALENDKAGARPAPGDTTAGGTASTTAIFPGPFKHLTSTVTGKIIILAIFTTLVLGGLWLFGDVSRTKPARENIAAALMHELAGLEVLSALARLLLTPAFMRRSRSFQKKCVFLILAFSILLFTWLQITQAAPQTAELGRVVGAVSGWFGRKFLLGLSATALLTALSMLWLLLCDARRWLVGASLDSPPEGSNSVPGSAAGAAAAPEVKAGAHPAPDDVSAASIITARAPPEPTEELEPPVVQITAAGKIAVLLVCVALVLGDLCFFDIVSLTKPARENTGAALVHELAGLEVLCVLFAMLGVFMAWNSRAGAPVSRWVVAPVLSDVEGEATESEGGSGLPAGTAFTGEKDIRHSEEMV
ncbi:hypothetical protein GGX14DRAFT_580578 [Mycena pura]|uniref:Uncharacterized protein n=1 Tax=Mycena pura TaxID=153505 RepID=A0AAD6Y138_9AGAR|nr:hypothetical protein GGX14DRAFT_580578 [Mycena pura]